MIQAVSSQYVAQSGRTILLNWPKQSINVHIEQRAGPLHLRDGTSPLPTQ